MSKKLLLLAVTIFSCLSLNVSANNSSSPKTIMDIIQPASSNYQFCRIQYENCRNGVGAFQGLTQTWKCQVAFDRCRIDGSFVIP